MCGRVVSHTAIQLENAHEGNDVADQAYDPSVKCMVEYGHHGRLGVSSWVLGSSRGHAAVGESIDVKHNIYPDRGCDRPVTWWYGKIEQ